MLKKIQGLGLTNTVVIIFRKFTFALSDIAALAKALFGKNVVVYLGFVGHKNLGDEILFDGHKELFTNVTFIHINYLATLRVAAMLRKPYFKYAILGGGTLIDHSENWITRVETMLSSGTRMYCFGTGVEDPIYWPSAVSKHHLKRWIESLKRFEYVGVRGPYSQKILSDAGLKTVEMVGDTALILAEEERFNQPLPTQKLVGLTFGITPGQSQWGEKQRYKEAIIQTVRMLLEKGYSVKLLPIWDLDIKSNQDVLKAVNSPKCQIVKAFGDFSSFSDEIAQCDFFIGQKLHASIMALMAGVPTIMIEYQPKCRDFMASFGLEQYIIKTSDFDADSCAKLLSKLEKDKETIRRQAQSKVELYKNRLRTSANKHKGTFTT